MKLDRDVNADALGKYAIINLRKLDAQAGHVDTFTRWTPGVAQALKTLEDLGVLEWGVVGQPDEFFLIKLKDRYAEAALKGYAAEASADDPEYARAVLEMAQRAGTNSPFCKKPD